VLSPSLVTSFGWSSLLFYTAVIKTTTLYTAEWMVHIHFLACLCVWFVIECVCVSERVRWGGGWIVCFSKPSSVITQCIILTYWTQYCVMLIQSHIIQNVPPTPGCMSTKHSRFSSPHYSKTQGLPNIHMTCSNLWDPYGHTVFLLI
jgi:hypothetical protein